MAEEVFKVKEKAKVNPLLSGLEEWVEGVIIKIFKIHSWVKSLPLKMIREGYSTERRNTSKRNKHVCNQF